MHGKNSAGTFENTSGSDLTLAEKSSTNHRIVLAADAVEAEQNAALELRQYLEKITGANFSVVDSDNEMAEGPKIFVGPSVPARKLAPVLDSVNNGAERIVIKTAGPDLVLAGDRPHGTIFCVYTFLQDIIGCRWYAPDATAIPYLPTLILKPLNIVYQSPFKYRQVYTEAVRDPLFALKMRQNGRQFTDGIPQSHGGSRDFGGGHTLLRRFLKPADYFDSNPHWYALDKPGGKRIPAAICFTEPEAQRRAASEVLQYLNEHPETRIISISQDDRDNICHCDNCDVLRNREGGEAGPLLHFVNAVAEQVANYHPQVLVSTLAYWITDQPPATIRPRDNVLIQYAMLDRNCKLSIEDIPDYRRYLESWKEIAEHLYIWDYEAHFANNILPHPNHFVLAGNLPFYRDHGVEGLYVESAWCVAADFIRMRTWVNSQMMWNPDQNERELSREFLNAYYGAAGPYLLQYIDLINQTVNREHSLFLGVYTASTKGWLRLEDLNAATRLFNSAEDSVADNQLYLHRVRRARLTIDVVWIERYREFRRTARQQGLPFLGPDNPYAEMERLERNEFGITSYKDGGDYEEYISNLRAKVTRRRGPTELWPVREGKAPPEVHRLDSWQWEEIQQDMFEVKTATARSGQVEDPLASNGKALWLEGTDVRYGQPVEARFSMPEYLADNWRIYAVVRGKPVDSLASGGFNLGIYAFDLPGGNPAEVSRTTVSCPMEFADQYRTIDLGTHRLVKESTVNVQINMPGCYGRIEAVWVDRLLLVQTESERCK